MLVDKEEFLNHSHKKMEGDNQPDKLIYILGGTNITLIFSAPRTKRNYEQLSHSYYHRVVAGMRKKCFLEKAEFFLTW